MNEHPALPMIRAFEQFRSSPYWDVNHHRVGYGSDTITRPDGTVQEVKPGMSVTQDDAERDLQRRVAAAHETIKSQIGESSWNKLGPNGQAALTSVHYNYGHLPWSVQNAAASGEPAKVASSINGLSGDNDGVNAKRRQAEANTALGLGNSAAGRFGLNGVVGMTPGVNRPNVSGSGTNSENGTSDLLSQIMKSRNNPVPAYAPTDGKTFANSPIEGMIRAAAGQGTYTPPIVSSMQRIGNGLNSLFGGSNQASQGSAPAPGNAASVSASPADAAPPPPPPASDSQASAGGGTNSGDIPLPPPRPNDLGTPVADASSGGGLGFLDSLKGLFGNAG